MNYNKQGAKKQQKKLASRASKWKNKLSVSAFKLVLVFILAGCIMGVGAGCGMLNGALSDAPDIEDINVNPSGFKSKIVTEDGETEITTLSTVNSNRIYAEFEDIPDDLKNAFVAIEDSRFYQHNGIDIRGIGRAFVNGASSGHFNEGASTLTQQLIKNQVFNVGLDEVTFMDRLQRKIQEWYLAIELEKTMTKDEIFECYLNTIYLGQGTNGVQSACETYFNKELSELTLSEAAVIAAITQNPTKYDPTAYPENNNERRQEVLKKMLEQEYITEAEYQEALDDDVYSRISTHYQEVKDNRTYNSYYTDATIQSVADKLMEDLGYTESQAYNAIYAGGLTIYSCQDLELQEICDDVCNDKKFYPSTDEVALDYALTLTVDEETGETANYDGNSLVAYFKEKTGNSKYNLIFRNKKSAEKACEEFKEAKIKETGYTFLAERITTTIQPQISLVLMDQKTGYVKAIVGGRGPKKGNLTLNRATDAERQPGSTFKVLAAFVPALDTAGMSLATAYVDEPFSYTNGVTVKNWYGGYRGLSTIRDAIRDSMNIIAVKTVTDVTPQVAYDYLIQMGFTTLIESQTLADGTIISDINQSLALGGLSTGVTNLEITAAYASIANQGTYTEPIFFSKIIDHDGNVLLDNTPETRQVMKETTAWLILNAMKDCISKGTGTAAQLSSRMPVAGKTGTTSSTYDVWFCGSTPYYTMSVWSGYDVNTTLGSSVKWHKQIWASVMNKVIKHENQDTSKDFEMPSGIVRATVCKKSGLLPGDGCPTVTEYFAKGTVPTKRCSSEKAVKICNESHMVATDNCPSTTTIYYFINTDGTYEVDKGAGDITISKEFLSKTCTLHPATTKYTISTSAGKGGTITSSQEVEAGGTVTIYIQPEAGYTISDVIVDGQSRGAVSSFTFKNVSQNHTITATFSKSSSPSTESTQAPTEAPQPDPEPEDGGE